MLYQLPNGKVIEISTEQYIEMSDEELEYFIAYNYGEDLEDPWFGSILSKQETSLDDLNKTVVYIDITEIPNEEKLDDLDIDLKYPEEQ